MDFDDKVTVFCRKLLNLAEDIEYMQECSQDSHEKIMCEIEYQLQILTSRALNLRKEFSEQEHAPVSHANPSE